MRDRVPPLNGLKAFEAAARHGSFVRAAEELGVTSAAVSQQVKALERYLGRMLFVRLGNGLALTDAGQAAYPDIAKGFNLLSGAGALLQEGRVKTRLTLSVLPSVAVKWLGPVMAAHLGAEPDLDVNLRVEEDPVPFAREGIDLRLCYGQHHYPGLVVDELVADRVMPLCRPELLAGKGSLEGPEDLLAHKLIHTDWGPDFATHPTWADWFRAADLASPRETAEGHRVTMSSLALDLAALGAGVALGQELLARAEMAAGRLVSPFGPALPLKAPYCLVYPHARADWAPLRALVGRLRQEAAPKPPPAAPF